MIIAVSPYHITTREPVAMAALLLADRVVTWLPAPGATPGEAAKAATRVPSYLDMMLSWQWSVPLWEAGVIGSTVAGEEAAGDVRHIHAQIATQDRYRPLRSLMRADLLDTDDAYLHALAEDVLKGGPDPAITVPLAAGIDRFAMRHRLAVARSSPSSVVQKAEARLGDRLFAVVVPALLQGSGERILAVREALDAELSDLRAALSAEATGPREAGRARSERLDDAAAAYARSFDRQRGELLATEDDEVRAVDGAISITGVLLPGDAVLTSSLAALRSLGSGSVEAAAPARARPGDLGEPGTLAFMVKVLGRVPALGR